MADAHALPPPLPPPKAFRVLSEAYDYARGRFRIWLARQREASAQRLKERQLLLMATGRHPLQRVKRDPNFPCPACGARQGTMRWAPALKRKDGKAGALVHQCSVCKAAWGDPPIFRADEWLIALTPEERRLFEENKVA